jgi:Secretion system C-terminal sorting domain
MKTKLIFSTLGLIFISLNITIACSCYPNTFCEFMNSENVEVAFRGKVIRHTFYNPSNLAIYVEIEKKYNEIVSLADTIKLYGGEQSSLCEINLIARFPIGTTIITAIGKSNLEIINPDSLTENYWEIRTSACSFLTLKLEEGSVIGKIAPNVSKYKLEFFEEKLKACNFSKIGLINFECLPENLIVYPNPTVNGRLRLNSSYFKKSIEQIRIFSIDGKLIRTQTEFENNFVDEIELTNLKNGIHIIELTADGERCYRKIIVVE